ncbi:MAG: hypothetical protein ABIT38_05055, partial [Gemmatimonadaceae bacterium]
ARSGMLGAGVSGGVHAMAALMIVTALVVGSRANAQSAQSSAGTTPTTAPLVLQLRPRAGDTLRLRIDQTIEMGGTTRAAADDSIATQMTTLMMLARLAVESTDADGATVVAVTDSVRIESNDPYQSAVLRSARQMQGQRVRFRVAPDGGTTLSGGDAWSAGAIGTFLSQLPATLPREAIVPGGTWMRSLDIPLATTADGRGNATLTATFRFDSLSRSGDFAYLTMKGRLARSGPMPNGANGAGGFVQTSGSVTGNILIDRRRGWIADARTIIALRSLVYPKAKDALPVRVRMKITQWMRVM